MAVYTTITDLTKRLDPEVLAALADDINSPPLLSDPATVVVLERAMADGAMQIDAALLGLVDLANPAVQEALERHNATLALYFLYRRRYLDDRLNPLASAREMVLAHLAAVARGQERIADGADGQPELTVFSSTEETERVFSQQRLEKF
jgi:phage gp36-like protein